ncbi:MAG: DUF484 family protein [Pelagibacteraceae bacterium TMED124]|nr:hypothetical protein [Rickettsiales bacterium]RPG19213.1 MAG: DUF484 family protein [Pelagibacteraceae bacterium TMED124]|tara:strand:- start:3252 stop:3905 length:654 start_codon:yes stop_codon:yes gene_type:complete
MLSKKIKIEDIKKFLSENPSFFIENPNLLKDLQFPSLKKNNSLGNKVVSFKDWLINNLRFEKEDLIENAKYNYLTQKKIHQAVISIINKNDLKEFLNYLNNELPKLFHLEIINIVCTKKELSSEYNLIFLEEKEVNKYYRLNNHFIMDAVDDTKVLYKNAKKKIYSNAIFSLNIKSLHFFPLLTFASTDKHFVSNRAYDLILFLSKIIKFKLEKLYK